MHIVGTAGHVDHGKSTLVAALTGTHPDRLKEEIDREMTIDLGFASMTLPNGETVGIIDVPGHRDFIGNMLSGIGGIDAVLLVIAADEGVSAQTREHLAIIDLLEIERGVVVLTKTDLAPDPDWLDLVEMEAREILQGTSLAEAPVARVSAKTGAGLPELVSTLQGILAQTPPKRDLGRPRLPVDRVFTLTGFGTVVTGTLLDGSFTVGDEVVCLPAGLGGRVRGLQNHKHKLQKIQPGFRTAMNINGIDKDDIHRGDVVALPNMYTPTHLLDAHIRVLADAGISLKHNMAVSLFISAAEVPARLRLLGTNLLEPGQSGFVQLRTEEPVVAEQGDHLILRLPSPSATLGGGVVLDAHPTKVYRRFDERVLKQLETRRAGKSADLVLQALGAIGMASQKALLARVSLPQAQVLEILEQLRLEHAVTLVRDDKNPDKKTWMDSGSWAKLRESLLRALQQHHADFPFKKGMPREQLRALTKLNQDLFESLLTRMEKDGEISTEGVLAWLSNHQVRLSEAEQAKADPVLLQFSQAPYAPPSIAEVEASLGEDLLEGLVGSGQLVRLNDQVLLSMASFDAMKNWVAEKINTSGSVSLAEVRDHFETSRKYAAALLEYLDEIGFTARRGDIRVLRIVK